MSEFRQRFAAAAVIGIGIAAVYSAFVVVVYLLTDGLWLETRGFTLVGVLAVYFCGGVLGAAVFALAAPLATSGLGAGVVGTLIMLLVFSGAAVLLPQASFRDWSTWASIFVCASIIGGYGSYSIWKEEIRR